MLTPKQDARDSELPVPLIIFGASLAVLIWHAAPSVSFHDSGEFAMAAASGGITHPPGSPTWTLLASAFLRVFRFADPARGANLFSALCGSVTLALLAAIVQRWCRIACRTRRPWISQGAGLAAAAALLHSPAFIQQSTIAEQYTLLTALLAAILLELTAIHAIAHAGESQRRRWLALCFALGATWGLAIGNHPSQVSLCFLVGSVVLIGIKRPLVWKSMCRTAASCAVGLGVGLLIFLWLPLRSRADPFLDWGNVETLERFLWAISRSQWETRPLSEAPRGFMPEWFATYAPPHQLGWLGFTLAGIGLAVLARRQRLYLGWLLAAAIPYAAGLLLAHMHQRGIDIAYIRQYGITDWHLPIYFAGAVAAGIGFGWLVTLLHECRPRLAVCLSTGILVSALWATATQLRDHSYRNFRAPLELARTTLAPLPDDAVVLVRSDNLANLLAYYTYFLAKGSERWVANDIEGIAAWIASAASNPPTAGKSRTSTYLQHIIDNPDLQPLHLPPLSPQRVAEARVFMEFNPAQSDLATCLLPRGFLFELVDGLTPDRDVNDAERNWRREFPQAWKPRRPDSTPLECEAWSLLYLQRAAFFQARKMWWLAEEAYQKALEWSETDGAAWYCLGGVREQQGKTQAAAAAYAKAIVYAPYLPGPRVDLALIHAQAGGYADAERLLLDELKLDPASHLAATNLTILRATRR